MILYHFCPAHLKSAILMEGLTKGGFPLMQSGGFVWHVQWLTSERDRRQQTWATKNLISYSRTAYRLTIDIPDSRWKKLMKALDWVSVFPDGWRPEDRDRMAWSGRMVCVPGENPAPMDRGM